MMSNISQQPISTSVAVTTSAAAATALPTLSTSTQPMSTSPHQDEARVDISTRAAAEQPQRFPLLPPPPPPNTTTDQHHELDLLHPHEHEHEHELEHEHEHEHEHDDDAVHLSLLAAHGRASPACPSQLATLHHPLHHHLLHLQHLHQQHHHPLPPLADNVDQSRLRSSSFLPPPPAAASAPAPSPPSAHDEGHCPCQCEMGSTNSTASCSDAASMCGLTHAPLHFNAPMYTHLPPQPPRRDSITMSSHASVTNSKLQSPSLAPLTSMGSPCPVCYPSYSAATHGHLLPAPGMASSSSSISPGASVAPASPVVPLKPLKQTVSFIAQVALDKSRMPPQKTFLLGIMAGMYIAIGALLMLMVGGAVTGPSSASMTGSITNNHPTSTLSVNSTTFSSFSINMPASTSTSTVNILTPAEPGIQRLLQGAVFPFGLMLVFWLGGELLTGNLMVMSVGVVARSITLLDLLRNWFLSYAGNLVGSLLFAYFMTYLTTFSNADPVHTFIVNLGVKKATAGWGVNLLKGIGCNWLVCIAVWNALSVSDLPAKMFGVWWPIFTFVAIGFEHSVANMYFMPLSLLEGANFNVGDMIIHNWIPVTLGNLLGALVVGGVQFAVHADTDSLRAQYANKAAPTRGGEQGSKDIKLNIFTL